MYFLKPIFSVLFSSSDKKLLKPTAVPSLNLNLRRLTDSEMTEIVCIDTGHERALYSTKETDIQAESRKRISNIIVVDLTKDKRAKFPERPKVKKKLLFVVSTCFLKPFFLTGCCCRSGMFFMFRDEKGSQRSGISVGDGQTRVGRTKKAC